MWGSKLTVFCLVWVTSVAREGASFAGMKAGGECVVVAVERDGVAGVVVVGRDDGMILWEDKVCEGGARVVEGCGVRCGAWRGFLDGEVREECGEEGEEVGGCGIREWERGTGILSDAGRGRLVWSVEGAKIWAREDGLSGAVGGGFWESRGGRVLVVLGRGGRVFGLRVRDGEVVWTKDVEEGSRAALVEGHRSYVVVVVVEGSSSKVLVLEAGTGEVLSEARFDGFIAKECALPNAGTGCVKCLDGTGIERSNGFECVPAAEGGAVAWFVVSPEQDALVGYEGGEAVWKSRLPMRGRVLSVASIASKDPFSLPSDRAPARVTGARSLLFKVMTPSITLVIAEDDADAAREAQPPRPAGLTATLIDTLTGSVIDSRRHTGGSGPVSSIRAENWFVYTFWNAALLEQELHVIDMYESEARPSWLPKALLRYAQSVVLDVLPEKLHSWLLWDGEFSVTTAVDTGSGDNVSSTCSAAAGSRSEVCEDPSSGSGSEPLVNGVRLSLPKLARTSYLVTHPIISLGVTVSERGATDRSVLLGLSSGRVVQIPRTMLDPRRPQTASKESYDERLMPYAPVLSLWPTGRASHLYANKGFAVRGLLARGGLVTSPVLGRESSCHFAALGVDISYSTLAPAGKFDALSDNFDFISVAGSICLLLLAVVSSSRAKKRRALDVRWME